MSHSLNQVGGGGESGIGLFTVEIVFSCHFIKFTCYLPFKMSQYYLLCIATGCNQLAYVGKQKQNTICKTRAQYAKRNCAFELFKVHFDATINAKNASFRKKLLSTENASAAF